MTSATGRACSSDAVHPPWTVRMVARAFDVSPAWVYKMVEANELPHHRNGPNIWFSYDELVIWLNSRRQAAHA